CVVMYSCNSNCATLQHTCSSRCAAAVCTPTCNSSSVAYYSRAAAVAAAWLSIRIKREREESAGGEIERGE
ncbi:hypothetical protein BHE74_00059584, partial [Ensete ventricosum]